MNSQISRQDAATELLSRRKARNSLIEFTRFTKPDYEVNWHHEVLGKYLDQFVTGEIRRLMVFMPPRHGKSELVSRRLPAYLFGKCPNASIISCSYSADLASRMNRDVQRIIDSPEYHRVFPETTLNSTNIRTTSRGNYLRNSDIFEIVGNTGVYRSAGIGGGITGMGMDFGIIDDPIKNRDEAISHTYREKVWEWYTSTFYTRMEKGASLLLTMTRWHEDDLAGRILAHAKHTGEEWTVINFPAIAEESKSFDDPRESGEPLWPGKYTSSQLDEIRNVLGLYQWLALYQQRPTPIEGGMWKYDTIDANRVQEAPDNLIRITVGVDPAVSANDGSDETGIVVAGADPFGHFYVLDDASLKGSPHAWGVAAISVYQTRIADVIVGEVNNGGDLIEANLRNIDRNVPFKAVHASRGKQIRAEPIAALYESGRVHHVGIFPRLEDQMCRWVPGEKSPDRMDALTWALWELSENMHGGAVISDPILGGDIRGSIPGL